MKRGKRYTEDLKFIDVVIEIRDARIPISSQNPDMQELIKNKKQIIILNKSDLADEKETAKWINYFKNNKISAISANSNSGDGIQKAIKEIENIMKDDKILQEQK